MSTLLMVLKKKYTAPGHVHPIDDDVKKKYTAQPSPPYWWSLLMTMLKKNILSNHVHPIDDDIKKKYTAQPSPPYWWC